MSRAFSNGTEFEMWEVNWCGRCLRDAPFRNDMKGATGCDILARSLFGDGVPAEWLEQPADHYPSDAYHCIEFRPPGWRDPEPRPEPTPPGQGELLPRDDLEGVRMFATADLVSSVVVPRKEG